MSAELTGKGEEVLVATVGVDIFERSRSIPSAAAAGVGGGADPRQPPCSTRLGLA